MRYWDELYLEIGYSNSTLNVAFKSCLENQIKIAKNRIQFYSCIYQTEKCAKCLYDFYDIEP